MKEFAALWIATLVVILAIGLIIGFKVRGSILGC